MITKFLVAVLLINGANLRGAEQLIDLSGVYVENGMTIRASAGAPTPRVSLCGLLSGDLDSGAHAILARSDRRIQLTQTGDLELGVFVSGGLPGKCIDAVTKADGMKVDSQGVAFSRRRKTSIANYRLTLGEERRLVVTVEFFPLVRGIFGQKSGQRVTGVYAFPRIDNARRQKGE